MDHFTSKLVCVGLCVLPAVAAAEGNNPGIEVDTAGQVGISWEGVPGRSYFLEWSTDLVQWGYMPEIASGAGYPLAFGFESDASEFFVRLKYIDGNVIDPKGYDFDGDGLSSWQEVNVWGTDPFLKDTNGDGLPDGQDDTDADGLSDQWEQMLILQLGNPTIDGIEDIDSTTDSDSDGVKDLIEYEAGLSGYKTDSDSDGYGDFLSVNQSLVLKLDEQSGSIAGDASPGQHDGTLVDAPVWQPNSGIDGGSLEFAGGNDAVTLPAAALDTQDDVSVSLWFKTSSQASTQAILSAANSGLASEFAVLLEQGTVAADTVRVHAGAGESFVWTRDKSLADGLWHHLVIVRNVTASSIKLYLDGQEVGSQSFAAQPGALNVEAITLGQKHTSVSAYDGTAAFVGQLDEIRIYGSLLGDGQVSELFQPNDLDADGLPDDYEEAKTGNLATLVGADDDLDGDGMSNRAEFDAGSDPLDYYNGQTPVVTLVSGDAQTIYNGQRTPEPLVFKLTSDGSTPLVGAPVTLEHLGLKGSVQTVDGKTLSSSLILLTDSNGEVSVFFKAD